MRHHDASRHGARLILVLLAIAVAGCATASVSETQRLQAQSAFEHATQQIEARQFALALTSLQQATTLDPTMALYRNVLGVVYLHLGRPDLALPEFRRAIELDADYAEAHLNQGTALAAMERWSEAVTEYERAIKSARLYTPDTAYNNLGIALYHLQRLPEAEQALRFAVNLNQRLPTAYYYLGLIHLANNRRDEAKQSFRHTRELAPNSPFGQAAVDRLRDLGEGG
jgi:Tfp pilus assembly protein PilF